MSDPSLRECDNLACQMLSTANSALGKQVIRLQSELDDAKEERNSARAQLIEAAETERYLRKENASLKADIDAKEQHMFDLHDEIEQLRAELEAAKKEIAFYKTRSVPANTPPIVCLCGSTRFMDAFFEAGWHFTLKGYIVLSVGVCKHAADHGGEALGQDVADKLDELHLRKIDLADEVFVLNVGGYIGDSTRKEIEYAKSLDRPIQYLESEGK